MKLKSSNKIDFKFNVDEKLESTNKVTFIDLSSEKKEKTKVEDETIVEYVYDSYRIELSNEVDIEANYDELLKQAKEFEYNELAKEVRARRDLLLEATDKDCLSDRTPSEDIVKYRQELRDITKQEGFPYEVVFPTKPTDETK